MSAFLDIVNLSKRFGSTTALEDVSLCVEENEFVCFLGPSGCGKTTLLRCIAGLEIQDAGELRQRNETISHLPPGRRDFGIVFQSYALFPNLSVEANIGYGLRGRQWPATRRTERVAEMLALVGLDGEESKYPAQLSGGQQQRVALARALAPNPSLLLLDEPLSALDAKVRTRLRGEIKRLQRSLGVTTVMVTHDQEEALTMADRVMVLNAGRVEQIDTPTGVYERPANPFVADFIGTMNIVPATHDGNGTLRFTPQWRVEAGGRFPPRVDGSETTVTCCVRPEYLSLSRAAPASLNESLGRVRSIEYLGATYRILVSPRDKEELVLQVDVTPERLKELAPQPDETLTLGVSPEALHLFNAGAEPAA